MEEIATDLKGYYGYYSATADRRHGSIIYLDSNGKEVRVTVVYKSKERGDGDYHFDDKVCVGPVVRFVRRVSVYEPTL